MTLRPNSTKARALLPPGYQFGDARVVNMRGEGATVIVNGVEYTVGASIAFDSSRPAGERFHWNVIEGDHH